MQKYNSYIKQYEKEQQKNKSFNKLYRKSSQDNVIDEDENKCLCNTFTKYLDETRMESFLWCWSKKELGFFSNIKLKFNLELRSEICFVLITCVLICSLNG